MPGGIAPSLLRAQVENTARWALEGPTDGAANAWRARIVGADALDAAWREDREPLAYFGLLLAAHFATVGTFVPTDVDTRIRFHTWQAIRDREVLRAAVALVDEAVSWDPRIASARVVETAHGPMSGHDGEWLAVRAGALGRAVAIGDDSCADAVADAIARELERERAAFVDVVDRAGAEIEALMLSTVLAHNLGDLSRVIEAWPTRAPDAQKYAASFARLGHASPERFGGAFALAGAVNKAVMADENHRFLALRKPRALRTDRALLLPIGPFFDAWGATVARHRAMDDTARAEVLAALLEGHASSPTQLGYVRAMAGMHHAQPGGLDALAADVPARLRKLASSGPVRDAVRIDPSRFAARMANRYRSARDAARTNLPSR